MTSKNKTFILTLSFVVFSVVLSCGYHLAGTNNPMLADINTIAIPYFRNNTFEPGLESIFTRAFADEFIESRRLQVVSVEQADVILNGTMQNFREDTISYNQDDDALEYRVYITMNLTLERRRTGEVLWQRRNLKHSEEYPVSAKIVLSETAKATALQRLAEDLAERVHDSIIQGF